MTVPYTPILPPVDDVTVFPTLLGQSFISKKSPMWHTGLAESVSGRERRQRRWSYPKWAFNVGFEVLRDRVSQTDLARLYGFFNAQSGMFTSFSFFDPSDNLVTDQVFGTGDGVTTKFQLIRTMGVGNHVFNEPISAVLGTPKVSVGATNVTAFTIAGGFITFTTPPTAAATLTWSGQFMFKCRFSQDQIDPEQMMQGLWSLGGIDFQSDRR